MGDVDYVVTSSGSDTELGFGSVGRRSRLPRPHRGHGRGETIKLGFGSNLNEDINDESYGIDNVVVINADSAVRGGDGNYTLIGGPRSTRSTSPS